MRRVLASTSTRSSSLSSLGVRVASEWTRHGECNHCGWCCERIGFGSITLDKQDEAYLAIRGFRQTRQGPTIDIDFWAPCPAWNHNTDAPGCTIHDTDQFPVTCQEYPLRPSLIIKSPCSYWFERDGELVGGDSSPHPWQGTRREFIDRERL